MKDTAHHDLPRPSAGLDHGFGPRVRLLSEPYPMALLARLCDGNTTQPQVNHLVSALYDWLMAAVASTVLPTRPAQVPTRMAEKHPQAGVLDLERIAPDQKVVVVDVARAGILPAHRVYEGLHLLLEPGGLRQDHVVASRQTDAEGQVCGVAIDRSKIGGGIGDATVLVPDPMAATGTSLAAVLRAYLDLEGGPPRRMVAMHLIVTPEYLRRMTAEFPQLDIFAVRLDRGLSDPDVLAVSPGAPGADERGLDDTQYIVPGAGGVGEVLNNAWV